MAKEIERKYLVIDDSYKAMASSKRVIVQGYLCNDPERVVRVRIADNDAFITIKSKSHGATRDEWEYPIPADDARQMLRLCSGIISKTRYIVPNTGLIWEVDAFHGRNQGLVVAELELPSEDATFDLPRFVGREVTGQPQYYNSNLATDDMQ